MVIAVYRLWKCRSATNGTIANLGLAAVNDRDPTVDLKINELRGGRNYWFPERKNRTSKMCLFPPSPVAGSKNLTHGDVRLNVTVPGGWPAIACCRPSASIAMNLFDARFEAVRQLG